MRRTMTWMITPMLGMFLVSGLALAQEADEGDDDWGPPRLERLAKRLELTDEQVERIQAIHEDAKDGVIQLRKEMMRLRNDLEGEMLSEEPSLSKVRQIATQIGEIKTQLQIKRLESRIAVRGVLTGEQRDKFLMMSSRGHRSGRGMHGPRGMGDHRGPRGGSRMHPMDGPPGPRCHGDAVKGPCKHDGPGAPRGHRGR